MSAPKGNKHSQKGETARTVNLNIRVEPERRAAWKRAAAAEGLTMTDWVIKHLEGKA